MLSHGTADAEVERVDHLAVDLDLLALQADVGDPVLAAAVGAAGHVDSQLLVEARHALVHLIGKPARKAFGLCDRQLAELGAGAGHGPAPEVRGFHVQAPGR